MNQNSKHDGVKLLLSYEIKEEAGQAYYKFVLGSYIPLMQTLGLELVQAWHTAYGNGPHRFIVFVAKNKKIMTSTLDSELWQRLNQELLQFVADFHYKIVPYKEGFQY